MGGDQFLLHLRKAADRVGVHAGSRPRHGDPVLAGERPNRQKVDGATHLPGPARIPVTGAYVIADDVPRRDVELFGGKRVGAGDPRRRLFTQQIHPLRVTATDGVNEFQFVQAIVVLRAGFDHRLFDRRDLAIARRGGECR